MKKSILHITDLHLNSFTGTKEHLRKRYYQEYIDGLVRCIISSEQEVDIIVVSGDFIDKGKTDNFKNVTEILNYLGDKLKVDNKDVCVCIGNHDYNYKKEFLNGNNSTILRKPFYDFASNYSGEILEQNNRSFLKLIDDNTYFLSIDSTLGSNKKNLRGKPGDITDEEIDIVINDIIK